VRRLRPDVAFGADLIAGFPTETEAMFENSLGLVDAAGLSYLHVFPFSARANTPAARMPPVHHSTVKTRARRLREKGAAALAARLASLVGTEQELLVEKPGLGRTRCFASVSFAEDVKPGSVVRARISASDSRILAGRVLESQQHHGVRAIA
jgi:threonylcarbamoyladenosine tRNA methylthiotransferase MtaB